MNQTKKAKENKAKGDSLEAAIRILESAILKLNPAYNDKIFRIEGKKIIKVAGVHHEIDLWKHVELGYGYNALFIFECKNWEKKVEKDDVIVFSEKIRVAQAQRGFFVAKTFTRGARAQADTDPRVQLMQVREIDIAEIPTQLRYFHAIRETERRVEYKFNVRSAQKTGEMSALEASTSQFILNGSAVDLSTYLVEWQNDVVNRTENSFRTEKVPEGVYKLPFEDTRFFEEDACSVNNEPIENIKLTGGVDIQVHRAVLESRFEVEHRGRVYRAVVNMPTGKLEISTHELLAQLPTHTPADSQ